jgi:hypothetical protein
MIRQQKWRPTHPQGFQEQEHAAQQHFSEQRKGCREPQPSPQCLLWLEDLRQFQQEFARLKPARSGTKREFLAH